MGYLSFLREDAHHDLKVENQEEIMLLDTLNKEQKEAVLCTEGPLISPAALLVKVIAMIFHGFTCLSSISHAILCVITLVFPEPAPASIKSG